MLKKNLKNKNLFSHSLAVEAVMRRLAAHFQEDVERLEAMQGIAGELGL
ncbi:MAG: hypothetical protein ACYC0Q_14605 [Eubacteriales bacterium]